MQGVLRKIEVDEKGRITLPKDVRDRIKKKKFFIIVDSNGIIRLIPDLKLEEMRGIMGIKVGTENLREKEDDPNRGI